MDAAAPTCGGAVEEERSKSSDLLLFLVEPSELPELLGDELLLVVGVELWSSAVHDEAGWTSFLFGSMVANQ